MKQLRILIRRGWKRTLFAVAAVCLGLALCEVGARLWERFNHAPAAPDGESLLDFQQPTETILYREAVGGNWYRSVGGGWVGQVFPEAKPKDEVRILFLGGSAAEGYGVGIAACYPRLIEMRLNERSDGRRFRVLNMSQSGLAATQLAQRLEMAAATLKPDLVVTVMGNNEYLDLAARRLAGKAPIAQLVTARRLERWLALARLLRPRPKPVPADRPFPKVMRLKFDDETVEYANRRLAELLPRMQRTTAAVGGKMLVCTVASNWKWTTLREWSFAGDQDQPEEFIRARWALRYGMPDVADQAMTQRLATAPDDPAAYLVRGMARRQAGRRDADDAFRRTIELVVARPDQAREDALMTALATYALAPDTAACLAAIDNPLRDLVGGIDRDANEGMVGVLHLACGDVEGGRPWLEKHFKNRYNVAGPDINATLRDAARLPDTIVYDLENAVIAASPGAIPGWEWFLDYCHYNVRGHRLLAGLLAPVIAEAVGLRGSFPSPAEEIAADDRARRGRDTDPPELEFWAGVDYLPTLLTNEKTIETESRSHCVPPGGKKQAPTALSLTYQGNWTTIESPPAGDAAGSAALPYYRHALALDPTFTAATTNQEFIARRRAWLFPDAVVPPAP